MTLAEALRRLHQQRLPLTVLDVSECFSSLVRALQTWPDPQGGPRSPRVPA